MSYPSYGRTSSGAATTTEMQAQSRPDGPWRKGCVRGCIFVPISARAARTMRCEEVRKDLE
jgi:hypothetical protein